MATVRDTRNTVMATLLDTSNNTVTAHSEHTNNNVTATVPDKGKHYKLNPLPHIEGFVPEMHRH